MVDCWSCGGLLGIHSGISNFTRSNASANSASCFASCRLVSAKFQSFKHASASTVSGLRPHLLSDTTLSPTEKDASDATLETRTNNISRALIESMGYLLYLFSTNPIDQMILLHQFQVKHYNKMYFQ